MADIFEVEVQDFFPKADAPLSPDRADLERRAATLREFPVQDQMMAFNFRRRVLERALQEWSDALGEVLDREKCEAAWLLQDAPDLDESVRGAAQRYAATIERIRQFLHAMDELTHNLEEMQNASALQDVNEKARMA